MFIQNCVIRKNTKDLRDTLVTLGYTLASFVHTDYCMNLYCECTGNVYGTVINEVDFIDCHDNEDLFLAIASLRNDTDEHQWFIMKNKWYLSAVVDFRSCFPMKRRYGYKASPKELIKHFES